MPYLGVVEAVRSRLEGNSRKYVPSLRHLETEWGHAIPARRSGVNKDATEDNEERTNSVIAFGTKKVPIFQSDTEGAIYSTTYPSISFEIVDCTPRYDEYLFPATEYGGERYVNPLDYSKYPVQVDNLTTVGTQLQPVLASSRDVEQPMNIGFEVRVRAKDPVESAMLLKYVYDTFMPRDYIRVPMADDTYRSWDLLFVDYKDLDKREAVRSGSPGIERDYEKVVTYNVEGYLDNTATAELIQLVQKRVLRLQKQAPAPSGV